MPDKTPADRPKPARDALDQVRTATQELHQAIGETIAQRRAATKDQIENLNAKAKAVEEKAKAAVAQQRDQAKLHMSKAVEKLAATRKDLGEIAGSVKSSAESTNAAIAKALADARASVQATSEAVAARRAEQRTHAPA